MSFYLQISGFYQVGHTWMYTVYKIKRNKLNYISL